MKKNYRSVACPKCHGSDIDLSVSYRDEKKKDILYMEHGAIEESKEKIMNCRCKSCKNEYEVSQGMDRYVLMKKPLLLTCSGDVKLLSIFTSEFDRDFKLVSVSNYDGKKIKPVVMALVEDEEYPILMPDESGLERDYKKVKSLIFNTWMNRNR